MAARLRGDNIFARAFPPFTPPKRPNATAAGLRVRLCNGDESLLLVGGDKVGVHKRRNVSSTPRLSQMDSV
jgi:hypothetical protein